MHASRPASLPCSKAGQEKLGVEMLIGRMGVGSAKIRGSREARG